MRSPLCMALDIAKICGVEDRHVFVAHDTILGEMQITMQDMFDASTLKFLAENIVETMTEDEKNIIDWTIGFYNSNRRLTYFVRLRDGKVKFEHFEF